LRAAGLLDNRPAPGQALSSDDEDEAATGQSELFED
jgi:segregation and condensation protein B